MILRIHRKQQNFEKTTTTNFRRKCVVNMCLDIITDSLAKESKAFLENGQHS